MDQQQQTEDRSHWPISVLSSTASLINMLLPLVLVRLLSTEEIGLYKIFYLYLLIVPGLSMIAGVTSGLAYWAGQKERTAAMQISSLLILSSGILFSCIALIFNHQLTSIMGWSHNDSLIFCIAIFGAIAGGFFEEAAISTGRTWTGALAYAGFELVRTSTIVVTAIVTRNLTAILLVHAAMATLKVLVTYGYGIKIGLVGVRFDRTVFMAVWRYAFPVSLAWVFGVFVERADQLILSHFVSPTEFAFYTIGCLIVPPLFTLEHSITRVLVPQLSESFAQNNGARAARLYSESVENLALLFFPAVTGLIVFSEPIVHILFTPQYASAANYLSFFALTYLALVFPNDAVPRAKGQANWILKNFSIFSLFALILAFLLTWRFDAYGALAAVILSKASMRLYAMHYIHRETGWRYRDFLPLGAFLRISLICGLLGSLCLLVLPFFPSSTIWFLVCGPIFSVLYFPSVLGLKTHNDRRRSTRPRVLLLAQSLPIGGLERMVLDLAKGLSKADIWQPFVVAYDQDMNALPRSFIPALRLAGVPVIAWKKPPGFSLSTLARIILIIIRYDIRVLHTHHLGPLMYGCFVKFLLLGRVRLVHSQHSLLHLTEAKKYPIYERFFSRLADAVVAVSPTMVDTYKRWGIKEKRLHVIVNGVTIPDEIPASRSGRLKLRTELLGSLSRTEEVQKLRAEPTASWILYLARIHPVKGQRQAIELWSSLSEEIRRRAFLLVVGPEAEQGELEKIAAIAAAAPDSDRILFMGGTHDTAKWYSAADLFLSCSEWEGLPLAPLEALGSGLPLVLSDIPGHAFLAKHALLLSLSRINQGSQEVAQILDTLDDPDRLATAKEHHAWVKETFSVDRMVIEYMALYGSRRSQHHSKQEARELKLPPPNVAAFE